MTCPDPCDDTAWTLERIAAKRAMIIAIEAAITSLTTGAQSYQLDTGQTRQLVTKANLGSLRLTLQGLESDLSTLQARLGCAQFQGRPGW